MNSQTSKKRKRNLKITLTYALFVSIVLYVISQLGFRHEYPAKSISSSTVVLVWGIITTMIFFYMAERIPRDPKEVSRKEKNSWKHGAIKLFILQYEQMSAGIRTRDRITIVAGTIMISASMLLLGALIQADSIDYELKALAIATIIALYSIWFICVNLTTGRLNGLEYNRLRNMEDAREFRLHNFVLERIERENWSFYVRRPVWLYFFYILLVLSILILLT